MNDKIYYDWTPDKMLEVVLPTPDSFLKIKETLTRIGIASKKENKLTQSVHLLHKRGLYYLVHFLELFALDGKDSTITQTDVDRRNCIAHLLEEWGLLKLAHPIGEYDKSVLSTIKILPYEDKKDWVLVQKYQIGKRRSY